MDKTTQLAQSAQGENLVQMLLKAERISQAQFEHASELARLQNRRVSDILIEQDLVSPEDVASALSLHLNVPIVDLKRHVVQPDALQLVPEQTARKYNLIPLDTIGDSLLVVMADPRDIRAIEYVASQAKMGVQVAIGVPEEIEKAIDLNYKASSEIQKQVSEFAAPSSESLEGAGIDLAEDAVADTPIVRTVALIVTQAVRDRASDIHIEPQEERVRIRYRIDGVLHDIMSLPRNALEAVVSRLKVQAGMNIAERRRPQDGQFSITVDDHEVDIRAATCETAYGETVVLRILDKSLSLFTLPELGFLPDTLKTYRKMLRSPFGMILAGGPTGSGKTTTLYASINDLDRNERNIMTIEDPIEYRFIDIKQMQVNAKAGVTFASGLRACMRLDPDIILVGEIRDTDTAKTAVQAALTGHLVLSSIHANDAVGVLFRLMDLGVEPFLISSALVGIVAQRMVRRVCPHCREPYQPPLEEQIAYDEEMGSHEQKRFYSGAGCNLCANTGYLGRTGVFEVLSPSEEIRRMLLKGASTGEMKAQALREGMITLRHDGMLKVKEGITTTHEVIRNVFSIG
jgi:general secretion pathway protein E